MSGDAYGRTLPPLSVNLIVADVERSLRFHRDVLGTKIVYSDPDFAALRVGDVDFMLHADHAYDQHPWHDSLAAGLVRGLGAELRLFGIDPDAVERRARERGATVLRPATDRAHGWRETLVSDPDGYVWAVGVALPTPREKPAVRIVDAHEPPLLQLTRGLFEEYVAGLGVDLSFQGFSSELLNLPGEYRPPRGALFLALIAEVAVGCVALRPLAEGVAEMKRLYLRPGARGSGIGRVLAVAAIEKARAAGYVCLRLDTLPTMAAAIALYRSLGFREIPAYRGSHVAGSLFMELDLTARP